MEIPVATDYCQEAQASREKFCLAFAGHMLSQQQPFIEPLLGNFLHVVIMQQQVLLYTGPISSLGLGLSKV